MPAPWYRGNVRVDRRRRARDAPHCGQGAAQAIEDASCSARSWPRDGRSMTALDAFMERRFERCRFVVEDSLQIGAWEKNQTLDANPAMPMMIAMAVNEPL